MVYQALTLFNTLKQDILNDDVIEIKGVKVPNFFKTNSYNLQFEFCNQIIRLYQDYILQPNGYFGYENEHLTISKKDVVFDCGANMGLFAAYAASKGAQVYCFEPCSTTRLLLENTRRLYPNNIAIYPYALDSEITTATFCLTDNMAANHLSKYNVNVNPRIGQEQVAVITIDDFVANTGIIPTVIKMDIEGAEVSALQGAIQTLKMFNPKCVIAAYHTPEITNKIHSTVRKFLSEWKIDKKQDNLFLYKI